MAIIYENFHRHLEQKQGNKTRGRSITPNDTLKRLHDDFIFEAEGNHKTEETIRSYEKHFNKLYEFVGYYSMETQQDYEESREECRAVGKNAPISILDMENIAAHYHQYLEKVCYPPLKEQTIITCMRNFRVILYWAMKKKLIEKQDITVKAIEPPIKQTFTQEEIYKLTRKRPDENDLVAYRNWVMIQYLMATGNRIGSVLALNVEDVDFENNEIHVQHTKSRKPQIAALPTKLKPHLANWIRVWRSDEDGVPLYNTPLFCSAYGERLALKSASDSMRDYFTARRVAWEGFHKFRHSYAANWIRDGGDSLKLKTQLGHSSLVMTNRYANLYGKAVADDVERHSLISKVKITNGRKKLNPNTNKE